MRILLPLAGSLSLLFGLFAQHDIKRPASSEIAFPEGYAETYTNYLSLDRTMNPDQVIRLFANDVAMQGPDDEGKLPFGSVLVAEVYKAKKNDKGEILTSTLGRRIKGDLALIAVMQREEDWGEGYVAELSNGNWEFAAFKADGMDAGKNLDACRAC
ncbi:MAG: cytochrome P460 family protein, partial [Bacteroidota bacterium]